MADSPRSNRPAPRTPAAVEAELRRRVRAELTQARAASETGELDDAALAEIIARAAAAALAWHLEAPEHARNATLSSRSWRPAAGPRGGARPQQVDEDRPARGEYDRRPPRGFPPRDFDRPPRERDAERGPRPRDFDQGSGRPPMRGGGFKRGGGGGGGFSSRRPPRGR